MGVIFPETCTGPCESSAGEKQGPLLVQETQMPSTTYLLEVKEEIRRTKVVWNFHNQQTFYEEKSCASRELPKE